MTNWANQNLKQDEKPLVTFALFAYNQEKYIREAVLGALAQTYSPLEIILSDDCSSDRTYEIIQELADSYVGPHKIIVNRNEENLNIGGHVKRVGELAAGWVMIMAAGDDVSLPERADLTMRVFFKYPSAFAVFSDMDWVDDESDLVASGKSSDNCITSIPRYEIVRNGGGIGAGAAYAYRHECFLWPWSYPTFYHNEDRLLPLRAALLGEVYHQPQVLVKYRANTTGFFRTAHPFNAMAKYNERYMAEIVRTLRSARNSKLISGYKSFFLG